MIAKANKPLALKRRTLTLKQSQQHNTSFGQQGENKAVAFLEKQGYLILDRNIRYGTKEIDIVAKDMKLNELVFIEVKTRSQGMFGDPSAAVNHQKLRSMQRVAYAYLKKHQLPHNFRFDIISVLSGTISHYENVTWGRRR